MTSFDPPAKGDWVDHVLADWARERPDLDTAPVEVVARVGRLAKFLDAGLARNFRRFGLTRGDYDVIATLRRSGAPFCLPHKELMSAVLRSSGTISFRIDRLERRSLVRREPDPADARGTLVVLTDEGKRLFDEVAPAHLANEERLLAALTREERDAVARLLRKLLLAFEAPARSAANRAKNRQSEEPH
jgi:DNA-binding MarR family transcriptional regulator